MGSRVANAVVILAALLWFAFRARDVGWLEACAELLGVAHTEAYIKWRDSYAPRHRKLFQGVLQKEWLDASLAAALDNATHRADALRLLARREGHGVFTLPLFSLEFCKMITEEVANFQASGHRSPLPNSMNEHGVVLEAVGMGKLMTEIREQLLSPLSSALYGDLEQRVDLQGERRYAQRSLEVDGKQAPEVDASHCCDDHHAFTVRYAASEQPGLDMHHDDADVTLNVCLSASVDLEGSGLSFCGVVGASDHRKHRFTLQHQVGRAVIHLGVHRHGADDVHAGTRQNLIMWGRTRRQNGDEKCLQRHDEEPTPDLECLSWTHDPDFTVYRELPAAAVKKQQEQKDAEQLMAYVQAATEEQVAQLPEDYQPVVRLLKHMYS
mmetsp:Transcript_55565/g.104528  ORF Transcript_55565/g.104528 Transcript_55565/m.104528 type:complete len:382 (+) Transcript_55565:2-1147(+)